MKSYIKKLSHPLKSMIEANVIDSSVWTSVRRSHKVCLRPNLSSSFLKQDRENWIIALTLRMNCICDWVGYPSMVLRLFDSCLFSFVYLLQFPPLLFSRSFRNKFPRPYKMVYFTMPEYVSDVLNLSIFIITTSKCPGCGAVVR